MDNGIFTPERWRWMWMWALNVGHSIPYTSHTCINMRVKHLCPPCWGTLNLCVSTRSTTQISVRDHSRSIMLEYLYPFIYGFVIKQSKLSWRECSPYTYESSGLQSHANYMKVKNNTSNLSKNKQSIKNKVETGHCMCWGIRHLTVKLAKRGKYRPHKRMPVCTAIPNISPVSIFTVYTHIYILLSLCNVLFLSTVECKDETWEIHQGYTAELWHGCCRCFLGECCSLVVKVRTAMFTRRSQVKSHTSESKLCFEGVTRHFGLTFTAFNG